MPDTSLTPLRKALLGLHKILIDSERLVYEKTFGPIRTPGEFLQLLTGDPWFAWLRGISEIIVAIDEKESGKSKLAEITDAELMAQTQRLLIPSETGEGFSKRYFDALHRDPNVLVAHAKVMECFK